MFGQRTRTKKQSTNTIKFVPKKYQGKTIKFGVSRASGGFFLKPGLGKTIIALMIYKILRQKKYVKRMLIVAKLRICYNVWPKEIVKWGLPFTYNILHNIKPHEYLESDADIDIINYEGLVKFCDKKRVKGKGGKFVTRYTVKKEFKDRYDMVVFDESSKLKHTNTNRFKIVKQLIQHIDRRYLLTGTPAPNHLMDLFGQIYVIDNGNTFTPYITHFRNTYFYPSGYQGYQWKLIPGKDEEIYRKIKPLVISFGDEELDMPPLVKTINRVQLSDEAFKVYKELEREFIAEVQDGIITAQTAGVASGKLRQLTGGACYTGKGKTRETLHVHDEKIEECVEIVEELQGSPCIIAYEFNHELERILAAFPEATYFESGEAGAKIEDDWNAGNIEVLIGQTSAIAHGLNLQESGYTIILFTTPWKFEDYDQLIRRLWRQGQNNKVVVHHIIASNTIDEDVLMNLDNKDKTQTSFLQAMSDRLNLNISKEKPVNDVEIIARAIPNPPHNVYLREDGTMFMSGLFECIAGWMPDRHQQFVENCGGKVSKDETLKSLMTKTKKHMLGLFKATKEGDMYVPQNESLINELKQYYTEVNKMSEEAQSKFASSKKKITKKKVAKKTATKTAAPTERKAPVKKKATKKAAPPKKKVATTKKKVATNKDPVTRGKEGTIKLIKKKNPKREGTASYDRYELYKKNKKVSSFIAAGGRMGDIRNDEAKGYIKVSWK